MKSAVLLMGLSGLLVSGSIAMEIHVAPAGNDMNPGTADKPFVSLEKARDEIRRLRAEGGGRKPETADVILHGGTYFRDKVFELGPQDSNVRYVAAKGETPVLTSAREITGWKMADSKTPGLVETAKGKVWVADVPKGWCFHFLYLNGQPATRSRSVNHDNWRQWGRNYSFDPATPTGQVVRFHDKSLLKNLP